ncbi:hypothetical protein [Rhodovulum adriaticum]|uniref:Flagellar assembly protein FliH n=1 Tax=Rhodovulum adriaticum TaxID=35804 RepID=A0A4R2P148_RHOAD|nr:hypothetical protein [Rhodovulum adriaticum]MBK1634781.1 hypothetical protein [Rhodovulum adriaticum]TCP27644.1 flagellar assembly protein FliH [Rhodovulum adriaticum]
MRALPLEDFAAPQSAADTATEEARLQAYEQGYRAGWDDAAGAASQAQDRLDAQFIATLEEMAFGYHEARAHLMAGLAPLLRAMVDRVLPTLADRGFARTVADTALKLADDLVDQPLELHVGPETADALGRLLGDPPPLPLRVATDPTLGPGQALLSAPSQAREIDIDAMTEGLRCALDDFLTAETAPETQEARHHG